jgi:hypothetical protein
MTVKVVNLRLSSSPVDFVCDRTSPLGNPFNMKNFSKAERNRVCDLYEEHFATCLNPDYAPVGFLEYLDTICQAAAERDITIGCHCAPQRCHCDTIKNYIDSE